MSEENQNESKIIKQDFEKLTKFMRSIDKIGEFVVDVGIMGSLTAQYKGVTNAEVGFYNEFGTSTIPQRSFLREPLQTKSNKIIKQMAVPMVFDELARGSIEATMETLGAVCVGIIIDAFDSQGFGEWAPNAPSTIKKKGSASPLIATNQLRRSISYRVGKK